MNLKYVIACVTLLGWPSITPCFAVSLFAQALDNYDQKRYHAAAEQLEQVIKGEPKNAQAYYYLGATLEQLKDPDNAKKMYEACFKLNPFSPQAKQAKDALNKMIDQQAVIAHPYDAPDVVDTSVRNINQQVFNLQQDKLAAAQVESAYQLDRGQYRSMRLQLGAISAPYYYRGVAGQEVSNLDYMRSYGALAYAQRQSNNALAWGYQTGRLARESGNNLINSFNVQPSRPDEPQLRAFGTNLYVRNYTYIDDNDTPPPADPLEQLKAVAGRLQVPVDVTKPTSKT